MRDVWFVGDNFLRSAFNSFSKSRSRAIKNRQEPPYLHQFYYVTGYFQNKLSAVRVLARMHNAFIEARNARAKLPKYIIFIPDKDLITNISYFGYGATIIFTESLKWMLNKIDNNILRHKTQLMNVRPGVLDVELPKIVWVKMLKHPYNGFQDFDQVMAL